MSDFCRCIWRIIWVIENSCLCVFLGVFYLLRDWIIFVAGDCWSILVFPHKHLSRGSGVKEECRGAEVNIQTFLWIVSCSGSDCSLCLEIFFCTVPTFFNEVKVFSVSSQQACVSRQKLVVKGTTFIIFFFSRGMNSKNTIKHRNRYWALVENLISSSSAYSLFLITHTSPQNTNHISF